MGFALDLAKFAEKTKGLADQAVGNIVAGVAAEIDFRSPVGDASYWQSPPPKGYVGGRFRANWQLGVDTVPVGVSFGVDTSAKDRDRGGATTAIITAAIPDEAAGKVYSLVNNLPYAQRIENGWSKNQAPRGVVGLTAMHFQNIVDEAVAQIVAKGA